MPNALEITRIVSGRLKQSGYVVSTAKGITIIVDPGGDVESYLEFISGKGLKPAALLLTHGHYDHIGAVAELMRVLSVPCWAGLADKRILRAANIYRKIFEGDTPIEIPEPNFWLEESSVFIKLEDLAIKAIATPGHTPGGYSYVIGDNLFPGDTIMRNTVGRTDLYGGSEPDLLRSLHRLADLPKDLCVYPGHGSHAPLESIMETNTILLAKLKEPIL
jgi:hydroxyacylglutathione hydrolase